MLPIYHLTFHYQSRGDRIVGKAVVNADTLKAAVHRVAAARGLRSKDLVVRTVKVRLDLSALVRAAQLVGKARALQNMLTLRNQAT